MFILLSGTLAKKIWRTTQVNITLGHTTLQCAHITYMRKTPPWYYHGQRGLVSERVCWNSPRRVRT
jgi:hypothetical protein